MSRSTRRRRCYEDKITGTEPANLIGYWPLGEPVGNAARNLSQYSGLNGAHTATAVGEFLADARGMGKCSVYDGTNSFTNIYSAKLASSFNGAEGTLLIWAKVASAGVWTDGGERLPAIISVDGDNRIFLEKYATENVLSVTYSAGATTKTVSDSSLSGSLAWFCLATTWSKSADAMKLYINGAQVGSTQTSLGTWAGSPSACLVGAYSVTPQLPWSGSHSHCALWSKALTPGQIAYLSNAT